MTSENPAHKLVEEAYELMEQTLEQDEITQSDIEDCKAALVDALEHQRYPDGKYKWDPHTTNRECLEEITEHEIKVSVS